MKAPAVFSLLLWENNRGKYVFFGLIIGFLTFQSPLGLPGIQPMRKRARTKFFQVSKRRRLYSMPRKPLNAQLRSHSCFPDRLIILNEDRILSDDQKKGFRRKSKNFSDCRAFSFFKTLPGCGAYPQCTLLPFNCGISCFFIIIKRILHVFKFFKPCKKSGLSTGFAWGLSGESNASFQIKFFSLFYQ